MVFAEAGARDWWALASSAAGRLAAGALRARVALLLLLLCSLFFLPLFFSSSDCVCFVINVRLVWVGLDVIIFCSPLIKNDRVVHQACNVHINAIVVVRLLHPVIADIVVVSTACHHQVVGERGVLHGMPRVWFVRKRSALITVGTRA